jgi:sacsin
MSAEFGHDFGQKVDLTASIRNILRNYPEGTAILKELVQNADDAGAKVVSFCLDYRTHAGSSVAAPALKQFQGRALLVYNDAIFTEQDFKSIQRIGDSLKKEMDDSRTKIGRFGIGFNAVYHWTDLPSFVSAQNIVFLDPQARFLPNVNAANPGKMINFMENQGLLNEMHDQFQPYETYGVDWAKPFAGTLFRLPLRTEDQAESSTLSKRHLDEEELSGIMAALEEEASAMLLFLKSIEAIEIKRWDAGAAAPVVQFKCQISNATLELRNKRNLVSSFKAGNSLKETISSKRMSLSGLLSSVLSGSPSPMSPTSPVYPTADYSLIIDCERAGVVYQEQWEVCNMLGGNGPEAIARHPDNTLLRLVPWGGVAALVPRADGTVTKGSKSDGLAYCFLPLPVKTGLPVMVNAFFELSSNRRDVWQEGVDMTGDGKTRAMWNISLMRDILGPSYVRLLLRLKAAVGYTDSYQKLWPDMNTPAPWNQVVEATFSGVGQHPLLMSASSTSSAPNAIKGGWVTCRDAVLLPRLGYVSVEKEANLLEFLVRARCPVVHCREQLRESLEKSKVSSTIALPTLIRKLLRHKAVVTNDVLLKEWSAFILSYCLHDLEAGGEVGHRELSGLRILPLRDGGVGSVRFTILATDAEKVSQLASMGYSLADAMNALEACQFSLEGAMGLLTGGGTIPQTTSVYILANEEVASTFQKSAALIVDDEKLGPQEMAFMKHKATQLHSNVKLFQPSFVPDLLRGVLPRQALEGAVNLNTIDPEARAKLLEFLSSFWTFAFRHSDVIPEVAEKAAIVPCLDGQLLPLSRMSNLLIQEERDREVQDDLLNTLTKLGVCLVDASVVCSSASAPKHFWNYVGRPTRDDILSCFGRLLRLNKAQFLASMESLDIDTKDALVHFLGTSESVQSLNDEGVAVLKHLPLFRRCNESKGVSYTTLAGTIFAVTDMARLATAIMSDQFVHARSLHELDLLCKLGVRTLSRGEYYRQHYVPHLGALHASNPEAVLNNTVEMILELNAVAAKDRSFVSFLKDRPFVPNTDASQLLAPCELFDPRVDEIVLLMDPSRFPHQQFRRGDVLVHLGTLGLRDSLDWASLALCARALAARRATGSDNAVDPLLEQKTQGAPGDPYNQEVWQRGMHLLTYLDANVNALLELDEAGKSRRSSLYALGASLLGTSTSPEEENAVHIKSVVESVWMPTLHEPRKQSSCVPFAADLDPNPLAAPIQSRPLKDMTLCSASVPVCARHVESVHLKRLFGWETTVSTKAICLQLREIAKLFMVRRRDEATLEDDVQAAREEITALIPQLYQRLNKVLSEGAHEGIRSVLNDAEWIWVGDTFVSPDRVAFNAAVNAAPYLHPVPQDLAVYGSLLSAFGVKNSFTFADYVHVLEEMAAEHVDQSLPDTKLDLVISIITVLGSESVLPAVKNQDLFLPDSVGKLKPTSSLVYDDVPWLSGPQYTSSRAGLNLVHPSISSSVAAKFNINSLRMLLVNQNMEEIFSMPESSNSNMEAFGQTESLTSRLRTILDMYPDGNPIFSELIQNADDAGASVVKILVDESEYGTESLLGPNMAACQGASLLVYNDAQFREADFRSLASIGQGSKLGKLATTGRFGLGFNSVYHLTDTPTFVSGEHLVLLDPHTTTVPGASNTQPGLKIKFSGTGLHTTFPDQFAPFRFFGCDFNKEFPGTLFRFPLRTASLARRSDISKRAYTVDTVESLVSDFQHQISNHLMFLRSVKRIEVYVCGGLEQEPRMAFRAIAKTHNASIRGDQSLYGFFDKTNAVANASSSRDSFYKKLASTKEANLPLSSATTAIRLETGFGPVESESEPHVDERTYLIVSGLRGGEARRMACSEEMSHLKLVPLGAVAACVGHSSGPMHAPVRDPVTFPPLKGQAFCFLPLPVQTKLPVHVNGYFELSSNRRDIWRGDDTTGESKQRSDWNMSMLCDVIAPLYAELLKNSIKADASGSSLEDHFKNFLALLPCPQPDQPWDVLTRALFKHVSSESILWSAVGQGGRITMSSAYLLANDVNEYGLNDDGRARLERLLLAHGVPVVSVPKVIQTTLVDAGCVAAAISPSAVRTLYTGNAETSELSTDDAAFLLQYCVRDIPQSAPFSALHGVALVPLENGRMASFGDSTAEPVFFAGDLERSIVGGHTPSLVAKDEQLGATLANVLRSKAFLDTSNVRVLDATDMYILLVSMLPPQWSSYSVEVVERSGVLDGNDDWLRNLWRYVVEKDAISLFMGATSLPIVPILSPANMKTGADGRFCTRALSQGQGRVLHMFFKDVEASVASILADLGIFIYEEGTLGSLSYSGQVKQVLSKPSPRGFMEALSAVDNLASKLDAHAQQWSADALLALRTFVLDEIVAKLQGWTPEDAPMLLSLPIWLRHNMSDTCGLLSGQPTSLTVSDEGECPYLIPPKVRPLLCPPAIFTLISH